MAALNWLVSRIRNTLLLFIAWLAITITFLLLGLAVIIGCIVCIPLMVVGLLFCALYLCISGWFRTGTPEWVKILREKITESKEEKEQSTPVEILNQRRPGHL